MPAGKDLMKRVESHLDLKVGKTNEEIRAALSMRCTQRAIRYAIGNLILDGKARKHGGLIFAAKDLMVHIMLIRLPHTNAESH